MRRVAESRREHPDVLARRPWVDRTIFSRSGIPGPSTVDQVRELVDLFDRGLLSQEEFERQRTKVVPG
jgi:aryl-alcohol dehydrogenase-like predicted oxidoreductase